MKKYRVAFIIDGVSDVFTIYTVIENKYDLNEMTSELVRALHSTEFFTANRDPEYYESKNPGRVAIRTAKVINVVVKEA